MKKVDYFFYTQNQLKVKLYKELKEYGYHPVVTEDYIYAEGKIPIALMAHMDTVFPEETRQNLSIFKVLETSIIGALEGLGADDRAGIIMIMEILAKTDSRPHVIFTCNEETTLDGAYELAYRGNPFKDLGYIIQLDRHGINDCVFYGDTNMAFHEYVESFGFVTALGTYTDIDIICPHWKISGVNLSVGYRDEHTVNETLNIDFWASTYNKVIKMLTEYKGEHWKYMGGNRYAWFYS